MAWPLVVAGMALSAASQRQQLEAQKAGARGQAATSRISAAATRAEAAEAMLTAQFDVERIKKSGVRELADIEAAFAEAGIGLDEMTMNALLEAQTEIELSALMRQRSGRFEESQLLVDASALDQQEAQAKEASKQKFLGIF